MRIVFWQPKHYHQSGPAIAQGDSSAKRLWLLRLLGLGDDAFALDPSNAANSPSQTSQQSCQITWLLQEPTCELQLGPRYRDKCNQDSFGEGVQRRGSYFHIDMTATVLQFAALVCRLAPGNS